MSPASKSEQLIHGDTLDSNWPLPQEFSKSLSTVNLLFNKRNRNHIIMQKLLTSTLPSAAMACFRAFDMAVAVDGIMELPKKACMYLKVH